MIKLLYKDSDGLEVLIEDAGRKACVVFYKDNSFQYFMELGTFKNVVKMFQYGYLANEENESEE